MIKSCITERSAAKKFTVHTYRKRAIHGEVRYLAARSTVACCMWTVKCLKSSKFISTILFFSLTQCLNMWSHRQFYDTMTEIYGNMAFLPKYGLQKDWELTLSKSTCKDSVTLDMACKTRSTAMIGPATDEMKLYIRTRVRLTRLSYDMNTKSIYNYISYDYRTVWYLRQTALLCWHSS